MCTHVGGGFHHHDETVVLGISGHRSTAFCTGSAVVCVALSLVVGITVKSWGKGVPKAVCELTRGTLWWAKWEM